MAGLRVDRRRGVTQAPALDAIGGKNNKEKGFEMFWFRLIVVGGFGLLGLVAAIASIAQGLHP